MPCRIDCASLEQASTSEAQLEVTSDREPQCPGERVCWALGLGSQQPVPVLQVAQSSPCLSPYTGRSSSGAEARHGMGWGLAGTSQAKTMQFTRKRHINSHRMRTTPSACLKTKQWGTIWNQPPNCSERPSQILHKMM